jgi:hypothetical protein
MHEVGMENSMPVMLAATLRRGLRRNRIEEGITLSICGINLLIWFRAVRM